MKFWEFIDKHVERIDFKHIIAVMIVMYVFHLFQLVIFNQLPTSADKYASQIITGLIGVLSTVLAFWFSASSDKKDKGASNKNMGAGISIFLVTTLLFTSCATEKKFVKFHDKQKPTDTVAAHYCSMWYPIKETSFVKEKRKEGKPDTFKTEPVVIYANCDSAYRAALAAAQAMGSNVVVVPSVPVKAPGQTIIYRVDSFFRDSTIVKESGAKIDIARAQSQQWQNKYYEEQKKTAHENENKKKWRKAALWEGGILLLIIIVAAIRIYIGWKANIIKNAGKFIS